MATGTGMTDDVRADRVDRFGQAFTAMPRPVRQYRCCMQPEIEEIQIMEVDCKTVKAKLDAGDDFVFIDCREQKEYDLVRIEGATLIPMSQFPERLGELESKRNSDIIIHCHHGGRSLNVANWLKQQGFRNPLSMAGGIDEWAQEIDPSLPRY